MEETMVSGNQSQPFTSLAHAVFQFRDCCSVSRAGHPCAITAGPITVRAIVHYVPTTGLFIAFDEHGKHLGCFYGNQIIDCDGNQNITL